LVETSGLKKIALLQMQEVMYEKPYRSGNGKDTKNTHYFNITLVTEWDFALLHLVAESDPVSKTPCISDTPWTVSN
jgi:hypothetical protein